MSRPSEPRIPRIVLTGGPCAGKTTVAQVIARAFPEEAVMVPEAASLLFSGGFPRWPETEPARATQRAIFHVQRELEAAYAAKHPDRILVLDRGTVDGAAYWPDGKDDFFRALGTSLESELSRYDRVIYLQSAPPAEYRAHLRQNPSRTETWEQARELDERSASLWTPHPRLTVVPREHSFDAKIALVLEQLRPEVEALRARHRR